MKKQPTRLSSYFTNNATHAGWVVIVLDAAAPTVVHASREDAEAEANRIMSTLSGQTARMVLVCSLSTILIRKQDIRQEVESRRLSPQEPPVEGILPKLWGIYECRDGKFRQVVGQNNHPNFPWKSLGWNLNDGGSLTNKGTEYEDIANRPRDLVRKIVVGQNWKPWNGNGLPAEHGTTITAIRRDGLIIECIVQKDPNPWEHKGFPNDIVAFSLTNI